MDPIDREMLTLRRAWALELDLLSSLDTNLDPAFGALRRPRMAA